ncbi:MAG: IS1634 family transposase [Deltaproteobacteria bacterium]|nr:IS1634 family transposase [Deltaproteobacteria bacterium]
MEQLIPDNLTFTEVGHLPIVKEFAKQINLVDTINTMVKSQMQLPPGQAVLAMVLDTLSGRTPLYRLKEFFQEKDTELMLGSQIDPELFCDHNLGRVLDKIFDTGTQAIFSKLSQNAVKRFDIDSRKVHFDTTSISVYGDYEQSPDPFKITYGHSKDHRPDLKQFLISLLCVDRNIPIVGAPKDGNASDKTLNNELLSNISKHMASHGLKPGAFVYVADSAFVTKDNLEKAGSEHTTFLSRLPATFKECSRAVQEAVNANNWIALGSLAETVPPKKRPAAVYRAYETTVNLYDKDYRAIVVHSSAHDKRRHKRIDRLLAQKRKALDTLCKKIRSTSYFCRADAQVATDKLQGAATGSYHKIECTIEKVAKFSRGRPTKDKPRMPTGYEYQLHLKITADDQAVEPIRVQAGCFVLVTSLSSQKDRENFSACELLRLYKDQDGIERNFSFLKDPIIVNSIFLKKANRIEVLGLVLLISLLIWRLMEHCMRRYITKTGNTITGWKNKPTTKPTSFMMTTKFLSILVLKVDHQRQLARPLNLVQLEYLKALNVDPNTFTFP